MHRKTPLLKLLAALALILVSATAFYAVFLLLRRDANADIITAYLGGLSYGLQYVV